MRSRYLLGVVALLVSATLVSAQDKKKDRKNDQTSPFEAQARAIFENLDLNDDASIDKDELARAFRGPKAKAAPEPKETSDKEGNKRPVLDPRYPDQAYLKALDKNGDDKIDWDEFKVIADQNEEQFKKLQEQQQQAIRRLYEQMRRMPGRRGGSGRPR